MLVILSPSKDLHLLNLFVIYSSLYRCGCIDVIFNLILCVRFLRAGYGSESEGDEEAATVTLSSDLGRANRGSTKSAVKLQEIGPRMTMQLVKVEEGLCSGGIIFSEYGIC